jgi:nitrate reductase gamma subunit
MEPTMYELVRGPLVWLGFILLLGGSLVRLFQMGRLAKREKTVIPTFSGYFGLRSILHWVIPFNSHNMRGRPVLTIASFTFHVCLLTTPLFAIGHAVLWRQSWGIHWWSLPDRVVDVMTILVIIAGGFLLLRRAVLPEVRNVTTLKDAVLIVLVLAPFVTGLVAHHGWLPYQLMLVLHIVSGVLWLAAVPFTWLAHMLWFLFARAYMGSEFGAVRHARDW